MASVPAILGAARLGAFRLGYQSVSLAAVRRTRIRVVLAGLETRTPAAARRVRSDSLLVHDALNEAPNTCQLTVQGDEPIGGQDLRVSINSEAPRLLFNGTLQTPATRPEGWIAGEPAIIEYPCVAVDDLARLNRRRPFGTWTNVSATTVAQELLATFAPGFSSAGVEAGLPPVSVIFDRSEGFASCLGQIAKQIGGYFFVEDLVLYLFQTLATDAPDPVDADHPPLEDPPITMTVDDSQVRNRVFGKGHGEAALADLAPGATSIPVADAVMFNPLGGNAIAEGQVVRYTGVQEGGLGSLVGPGLTPSAAMLGVGMPGAGIDSGDHDYAYVWKTAAGRSLPSALMRVTHGAIPAPTVVPTVTPPNYQSGRQPGFGLSVGDTVALKYSYSAAATYNDLTAETDVSPGVSFVLQEIPPGSSGFGWPPSSGYIAIQTVYAAGPETDTRIKWIHVWLSLNGGAYKLASAHPNGPWWVWEFGLLPAADAPSPPAPNASVNRSALSGIAIGPAGTTDRELYRTVAGGAQLKLLATIANNTADTYDDLSADAALGANAPVSDTSGLPQPAGQINPGATSIRLASTAAFSPLGGWARAGDQVLRYTGISAGSLTGVPASGPGALAAALAYNTVLMAAPALTGIPTANPLALPVSIVVTHYGPGNAIARIMVTSTIPHGLRVGDNWTVSGTGDAKLDVLNVGVTTGAISVVWTPYLFELDTAPGFADNGSYTGVLHAVIPNAAITRAIPKGTLVNIWVERNDLLAQADRIALDLAQGRVSDGVIEGPPIVDERRGDASLTALCDAELARFSRPIVTVVYDTHDLNTKSGKRVHIDQPSLPIDETLTIQSVEISEIDTAEGTAPRFHVVASSVHFSLEDQFRKLLSEAL